MKDGKLAVVTGGVNGIGLACSEKLLQEGYGVAVLDIDGRGATKLLEKWKGSRIRCWQCNVGNKSEVQDVCADVINSMGSVSVLVNCAGIQTHCLFEEMTDEIWDRTININLNGVFYMCRQIVPHMISQGYGRVINIASMSARRGSRKHVHYCAAKAGVLGFTRALSVEAAPFGVTVNAVCPGIVETDMIQETLREKKEIWLHEMHVKRLGTPGDIANAVAFLASHESGWISGQALDINGGILTP